MNYIACADKNWGIGRNGGLLFSLPADMKFFRETTLGKTVVMGRKTLLSLPGGRPLKNRRNIVMTRDKNFVCENAEIVHSPEQLFEIVDRDSDDVFVIGGAEIYNQLYNYCKNAYITKVDSDGKADVFIKNLDLLGNWKIVKRSEVFEQNGLDFSFFIYENSCPDNL